MKPLESESQLQLPFKVQNKLIKQHNRLTCAKYNLTPIQKDIIYLLLSQIQEDDNPSKVYKFHISALYTRNRKEVNHIRIKQDIDDLLKQQIEIKKLTGWLKFPAIVSSIEYIAKEGVLELEISNKLRPYLFNLTNNFTTYWSETALNIKTTHAKRIYEMLSQYKDTGFLKISLRNLKERLYLINHTTGREQYPMWTKFKNSVLEKSKKELLETTSDITFEYKPVKFGKKCISVEFKILNKRKKLAKNKTPVEDTFIKNFKRLVEEFKLSAWQARTIVDNIPQLETSKLLYQIKIQKINGKISNIGAYTMKTFHNQYPQLFSKCTNNREEEINQTV